MAPGGLPTLLAKEGNNTAAPISPPLSTGTGVTKLAQAPNTIPDLFSKFKATRNMSQHEQIDHAIAKLICDSGTSPRLVDETAWKELLLVLGAPSDYSSPNSSFLCDKLIPAEAKHALILMQAFLVTQSNISLSFDGLTAGEQPVYTVHTCTADRHSFLYQGDVFYGSHNTDYVVDLLEQVVNEVGVHRITSVVSDDTNTTKKAWRVVAVHHPSILNLADPIHKINLCIQDICLDPLWAEPVSRSQKLLTHFKISTYVSGRLKAACLVLGILCGLQSIGKTWFVTMYYSASSILANLPALYKIYQDQEIDTVGTPLPDHVAKILDKTSMPTMDFRKSLTQLVNVIEPFARALLCLESTQSTLSDVYFFWLATLAALSKHFESKQSQLSIEDKAQLQNIIYCHFNEAINDAPTDIYVLLGYRASSIFSSLGQFNTDPLCVTAGVKSSSVCMTQGNYDRMRKQLFTMLRHELEVAENVPDHPLYHPLYQYDALRAKNELIEQLLQYHLGQPPFQQYSSEFNGPIQYWTLHQVSRFSFILSYLAEKLFLVLPNSMCDERTGSCLTHLYSKLHTQTDAKTMIEQIQFSQFNTLAGACKARVWHQKSPLRFQDIPREHLPEYNTTDTHNVALHDEAGDEWLDANSSLPFSEGSNGFPLLHQALLMHGVDLTSQLLISALSAMSTDVFSLPLANSVAPVIADASDSTTYTRAADVCWDD